MQPAKRPLAQQATEDVGYFSPELEASLVSFQVALIGADGLVIGSDTKVNYATPSAVGPSSVQQLHESKFFPSDDGEVICAYSGTSVAAGLARKIAAECSGQAPSSDVKWGNLLREVASREVIPSFQGEVLVVRRRVTNAAWVVTLTALNRGGPSVQKVTDRICTGDYLTARFVPLSLWGPDVPIQTLEKLALLALGYAADENPSSVGGKFELLILSANKEPVWKKYPADQIQRELCKPFSEGLAVLFHQLSTST